MKHERCVLNHGTNLVRALAGPLAQILAVGLLLVGCGRQTESVPAADLVGVYTLVAVDGKPLPATLAHGGARLEIRSGAFTIRADGTCASRMVFVPPTGKEVVREVTATCTRKGATLHLQWAGAGTTTGTCEGNTFTMENEGAVFRYEM